MSCTNLSCSIKVSLYGPDASGMAAHLADSLNAIVAPVHISDSFMKGCAHHGARLV